MKLAKKNITLNRLTIIMTILSFILLAYALIVVAMNPSAGYEISIYSATPIIFWVAITIGLLNGLILIVSSIFYKVGKAWAIGIFQVLLCNVTIISLYAFRGYVLYLGRGDAASYIGMAKDISIYGNYSGNFYPIISMLISITAQLSSISLIDISKYLPALFFVIYFVGNYCWAKSISTEKSFILSVLLASTPIFFAWFSVSIYHQMLAVWTLPLFFYCLHRNQDFSYRLICIVMCIIYPFWHPITSVFVCLYLIIWFLVDRHNNKTDNNVSLTLILLSLVSMLAWFINQYVLLRDMTVIVSQLLGISDNPSTVVRAEYYASKLGLSTAIKSLYLMINDEIIYYALSLISSYYIFKQNTMFRKKLLPVVACFIAGSFFLLINFFMTYTHTPDRIINLNFNMIFTPLLVGYLLYYIFRKRQKVKYTLALFLIGFAILTSVISLYQSPITMRPNDQITKRDVSGMNWLIDKKSPEFMTVNVMSPVSRFSDLIYGYSYKKGKDDLRINYNVPDHLGIKNKLIFPIDTSSYLSITDYDIRSYTELWKDIDRYAKEDFYKLNLCDNVDKIYENGELRNFLIYE